MDAALRGEWADAAVEPEAKGIMVFRSKGSCPKPTAVMLESAAAGVDVTVRVTAEACATPVGLEDEPPIVWLMLMS